MEAKDTKPLKEASLNFEIVNGYGSHFSSATNDNWYEHNSNNLLLSPIYHGAFSTLPIMHTNNFLGLSAQDFILSSVGSDKLLSIIIKPTGADTDFEASLCTGQISLPVSLP
jgi:hypothetical protein